MAEQPWRRRTTARVIRRAAAPGPALVACLAWALGQLVAVAAGALLAFWVSVRVCESQFKTKFKEVVYAECGSWPGNSALILPGDPMWQNCPPQLYSR